MVQDQPASQSQPPANEHDADESETGPERPRTLRDRVLPVFAIGIMIAFLGLMAYSYYTPDSSSVGSGGRVNASGSKMFIGDRDAPAFSLEGFDEGEISLSDYDDRWVIINFWASWCPPCRDEAPMLAQFDREIDHNEIALLGVAIWDQENAARDFLNQYDLNFPNASDRSGTVAIDYGVYGVPETYFIGPDGVLYGKYRGPLESAEHIHELLAEFQQGEG